MLIETRGDLFRSEAPCIVNTVNCVGVMGKGIALEFKQRYPEMFAHYRSVCQRGLLKPGMILPYSRADRLILGFAVKDSWRDPSRHEWVEACLERFAANYERLGIKHVAMPHLGRLNGWIAWPPTYALIRQYCEPLAITVELVEYAPGLAANEPALPTLSAAPQ